MGSGLLLALFQKQKALLNRLKTRKMLGQRDNLGSACGNNDMDYIIYDCAEHVCSMEDPLLEIPTVGKATKDLGERSLSAKTTYILWQQEKCHFYNYLQ